MDNLLSYIVSFENEPFLFVLKGDKRKFEQKRGKLTKKITTVEALKEYLESRNDIYFMFGVVEKKRGEPEGSETLFLRSKETKNKNWVEIFKPKDASSYDEEQFNLYEVHDREAVGVHLGMFPDEIEKFLREKKKVKQKVVQERLL